MRFDKVGLPLLQLLDALGDGPLLRGSLPLGRYLGDHRGDLFLGRLGLFGLFVLPVQVLVLLLALATRTAPKHEEQ
jgi:hypothetical protein